MAKRVANMLNEQKYSQLLYAIDDYLGKDPLIFYWSNSLKVKCVSELGIYESSTEPGDDDYIGEYYTIVRVIEVLQPASNNSVQIFNNFIEISLKNTPVKITLEDGTILWTAE